jgi:hypothetical protein
MITLITGGQSIQRKALMSSLTAALPNYCTVSYQDYKIDNFENVISTWYYDGNNDIYFILDEHSKDFKNLVHDNTCKFIDKHFHIVETFDNLFVYEFDVLTTELTNSQTIRNAKKYVFNPNYAHTALQPYINNRLFKNFKALCFFAFLFSLCYSIYAIVFIKDNTTIIINCLYIAVFCASLLMAFTTFQKVAYE